MEPTCEKQVRSARDEPTTAAEFRSGMRQLSGAVCIVTVQKGQQRAGLTATAVLSVSAEPPRLMVCVNRNVFAHELLSVGGALCVNVLGTQHLHHAQRFAGMVEGVSGDERFMRGAWLEGRSGAHMLTDALAAFECRVTDVLAASSHSMVLCEVTNVQKSEHGQPLIYFDGRFASLGEL